MEGQTDGRTDGHGQTYIPPPSATNKNSDLMIIQFYFLLFSVSLLSIQIIRNNTIWRSLHRYNVIYNVTSRRMRCHIIYKAIQLNVYALLCTIQYFTLSWNKCLVTECFDGAD